MTKSRCASFAEKRENSFCHKLKTKKQIIFIFIGILFISIFYLEQINSLATKGYKIRNLENKVSDLKDENKKLELQITELRSTERVAKEIKTLKMEEVARIEYLQADGSTVALNR
ncbi:MAG: hypothetical protein NTX00_04015 [Candidatus Parcubacteria bacterium]|nr:hypothetical protein [Candidatus Parcubacteria bacterium]